MTDARRKKVLTVLCLGSVILVWRVYAIVVKYGPKPVQAVPVVVDSSTPAATKGNLNRLNEDDLNAQQLVAEGNWGRDPFSEVPWASKQDDGNVPVVMSSRPPSTPSILLSGVSKSGSNWLAAVQGRIVRVGDIVDDKYEVIRIDSHSVTLSAEGWAFKFSMGSQEAVIRRLVEEP